MRKYTAPSAEKISFDYKNQVVASNAGTVETCDYINTFTVKSDECVDRRISFQLDNGN